MSLLEDTPESLHVSTVLCEVTAHKPGREPSPGPEHARSRSWTFQPLDP